MTPQEIAQRSIDALTHHSRDLSADDKLLAANELGVLLESHLFDLYEAAKIAAANVESAPIEGLEDDK